MNHLTARRALAVLATVGAVAAAFLLPAPSTTRTYTASFGHTGQGLDTRSAVRVRGVPVGAVTGVGLDATGRAVVRVRIDAGVPIPVTASARVESLSVFGPKDLVLDLGAGEGTGPYLPDHAPITRTADPTDLADAGAPLSALTEAVDPGELHTVVSTLAAALRGNGARIRRATGDTATLLGVVTEDPAALRRLIGDAAALTGTLATRADTAPAAARDLNTLLPVLTDDPAALGDALDGISDLADEATALLRTSGPGIGRILDSTGGLTRVLDRHRDDLLPLLRALQELFGDLAGLLRLPGPDGTLMGAVNNHIPLDPCGTFVDLCPPRDQRPTATDGSR
ncbi:MCE family protein [Actinocorallia sp. API 0066]|uniref:MCE family protein n=1 Tax=Actinocorallia sp. API 0066 TaxID=2896846 RepID=UPI001E28FFF0|nr:MlaD family protein [Actinocorallia sp. API 0066]MCD0449308.1 MCE family protein [Actinocorallia sp. API 0066]